MRKITKDDQWRYATTHYFDLDGELKLTVLHPRILREAGNVAGKRILDFGCGIGGLANKLANKGANVLAVDKSVWTLDRAIKKYRNNQKLNFKHVDPDTVPPNYKAVREAAPFDLAIVSLVLVTIKSQAEAEHAFKVLGDVVSPGGQLLLGESHPCFQNCNFSTFSMKFDLNNYRGNCTPFSVEVFDGYKPKENVDFTDYHRPLSFISDLLWKSNFMTRRIVELYDTIEMDLHPVTRSRLNDRVPPYILFDAIRIPT